MRFADALRYPFDDPKWVNKLITATLFLFIPIVGWMILMGYGIRIIRQVSHNRKGLPEWRNVGNDFNTGLLLTVGGLIYGAPILVFAFMGIVVQSLGGGEVTLIFSCCVGVLLLAYLIITTPMFYTAVANFAASNDFSDFFRFPDHINDVTEHSNQAFMLIVLSIVLWLLLAIPLVLGGVLISLLLSNPVLGFVCLMVYFIPAVIDFMVVMFAGFHLTGQWASVIGAKQRPKRFEQGGLQY